MRKASSLLLFIAFIFCASPVRAAMAPVAVSIFPPIEFPPKDRTIAGVRASILWGNHREVFGFDFGILGNITESDFGGLSVSGIFNVTHTTTTIIALQAAGIINLNMGKTRVVGLQIAPVNYMREASTLIGFGVGLANLAVHTKVVGFQVGLYNSALVVTGFQIGVVNYAETLHGIQIGLLNFHRTGVFPISPGINIGF